MPDILLIEDDAPLRQTLARLLSRSGYAVREAENGKVGLCLMGERAADLVVTDILMPEMEGIETIRHLRKRYPETRIVAISGGGRGDAHCYLKIARELGAQKTLTKPFFPYELLSALKELQAE